MESKQVFFVAQIKISLVLVGVCIFLGVVMVAQTWINASIIACLGLFVASASLKMFVICDVDWWLHINLHSRVSYDILDLRKDCMNLICIWISSTYKYGIIDIN